MKWISWIHTIMSSSKVNIMINGSLSGYVHYQRGLSQGDLLSPLLSVVVADALSVMCSNALSSRILSGVPLGSHGNICHM